MKTLLFSTALFLLSLIPTSNKIDNAIESSCTLQLVGLKCIQTEGLAFPDAIYFKINGQKWPSNRIRMSSGDYKDLEGYADITFHNDIIVQLWDDDTWDSDDFLGEHKIYCNYDNDGVVRFTLDGANYKLYYRVK